MKKRKEIVRTEAYNIHILGTPPARFRDLYHALLRVPWWAAFLIIVAIYLALNFLFAIAYVSVGGVANAHPDSLADAFFFSVQTMGTIGYGAMSPVSRAANVLVVCESVVGLLLTALITGLVFVRFSQTRARLIFSSKAAISNLEGVQTLMVRVGNERRGSIVGAEFRLAFARTVKTAEGLTIFRFEDLPLVRSRAAALSRAWGVMHKIVEGSPLYGLDAEKLAAVEGEIQLEVVGIDDTSLQPVHALHTWFPGSVAWNSRLADVLSERPDGDVVLDLRYFHEVVPQVEQVDQPAHP
jgi:inward rectifier potassium channel